MKPAAWAFRITEENEGNKSPFFASLFFHYPHILVKQKISQKENPISPHCCHILDGKKWVLGDEEDVFSGNNLSLLSRLGQS